ncbi:MAG: FAD-dependent oxidoreductase [Deltaproteobacteria bacterium]|nr:FAD-dependent oxidoreductase [Deltaproteobacteria bacterium]
MNVVLKTRVEEINIDKACVELSDGTTMPYDYLVMGTGSTASLPNIPGQELEGVFTLKNLTDAVRIKRYLREKQCRKATIIGAGFIALEMSEAFTNAGIEPCIVYRGKLPAKRWDPEFSNLLLEALHENGVTFLSETKPVAIEAGKNSHLRLLTNNGAMDTDCVLLALGVRPNVALAEAIGLEIGHSGAIKVDFSQRTSREEVYAVGDCCEAYHRISQQWDYIPLGDIANKQGRVAGQNIGGGTMVFPGVVGSQSFKLFNLEVSSTGLDEGEASRSGYHPISAIVWGNPIAPSLAKSLPGSKRLGLKLIAEKSTGALLGAQAVGTENVVSRINTLAVALWSGLDLDEIGYLDFGYAPPFGGAWDPIHIAAQTLKRKI